MKLWIDDVRLPPEDYIWYKEINPALRFIRANYKDIELIDFDHDAGEFRLNGKEDYIVILNELERLAHVHGFDFSHIVFRFHSANPAGVRNMRLIVQRNGWKVD